MRTVMSTRVLPVLLVAVAFLIGPLTSCCLCGELVPDYEINIKWNGSMANGAEIPAEFPAWYAVRAFAVEDSFMYVVNDSVAHQGSGLYIQPWTLPDDRDYFATVQTNVDVLGEIVTATCVTNTVSVFLIEQGDCTIEPQNE